jgi:hypothetical protein
VPRMTGVCVKDTGASYKGQPCLNLGHFIKANGDSDKSSPDK